MKRPGIEVGGTDEFEFDCTKAKTCKTTGCWIQMLLLGSFADLSPDELLQRLDEMRQEVVRANCNVLDPEQL